MKIKPSIESYFTYDLSMVARDYMSKVEKDLWNPFESYDTRFRVCLDQM